jgi:lipoyl(octanoyl) transferase
MDLEPFRRINPCGMAGLAMTQLADEGIAMEVDATALALGPLACEALGLAWDGNWIHSATSTTPLSVRSW